MRPDRVLREYLLLTAAGLALVLATELVLGHAHRWRVGPILLRLANPTPALIAAAALGLAAAFLGSRARVSRTAALVVIVVTALVALAAVARGARVIAGAGDIAVIESYTIDALDFKLLLGPYSRFGWHHPGPILFYWLAPFYRLSGDNAAGLAAGAVALNLLSLVLVGAVVARCGDDRVLAIGVVLAGAAYAVRFDELLASAWNPHVVILPMMAFMVVAAAVAAGNRWLMAALGLIGSFLTQTHVGLVPVTVAAGGVALVMAASAASRSDREWTGFRRSVNVTAWVLAGCWLLPIAEQLTHRPGNMIAISRFFAAPHPGQSFAGSFGVWAGAVAGWVQPSVGVPIGVAQVPPGAAWVRPLALVEVGLTAWAARIAHRRGQRFSARLAGVLVAGFLASLVSTTRIIGTIQDHEVFWMSCLSPLAVAVCAAAFVPRASTAHGDRFRRLGLTAAAGALVVVTVSGINQLRAVVERSYRPFDQNVAADTLADRIVARVVSRPSSKPLIAIDGGAWEVGAGVVAALQRSRVRFAVDLPWSFMFTDALKPAGDESERIVIAGSGVHADLVARGGVTIAARRGYFADVVAIASTGAAFPAPRVP